MDTSLMLILIAVAVGAVTGLIPSLIYKNTLKSQKEAFEKKQRRLLEDAKREAETIKKEAVIYAKDLSY
mgnify:FL=1